MVLPTDRVVLIDLENVVGFRAKRRTLRTRVSVLPDAAQPWHHAVAAYARNDDDDDATASTLAALSVAPLQVAPGPDAAELALLAHARWMQADGCVRFTVCSSDHAFAALGESDATNLEVLVWQGQPVATDLAAAADHVRRLPRPGERDQPAELLTSPEPMRLVEDGAAHLPKQQHRTVSEVSQRMAIGFVTGVGIAFGHHLGQLLLSRRHRRHE